MKIAFLLLCSSPIKKANGLIINLVSASSDLSHGSLGERIFNLTSAPLQSPARLFTEFFHESFIRRILMALKITSRDHPVESAGS